MRKFLMVVLGALAAAFAAPAQAQLPQNPGVEIVGVACTQCHGPGVFTQLRMNDKAWREEIYDMILRGAQIGPNDIDTAVKYMVTNFGPGVNVPQSPDVKLPDGQGKEVVEGGCALCHGLDRVVATKRPAAEWQAIVAKMVVFGAPLSGDQAKAAIAYLDANFSIGEKTAAK